MIKPYLELFVLRLFLIHGLNSSRFLICLIHDQSHQEVEVPDDELEGLPVLMLQHGSDENGCVSNQISEVTQECYIVKQVVLIAELCSHRVFGVLDNQMSLIVKPCLQPHW